MDAISAAKHSRATRLARTAWSVHVRLACVVFSWAPHGHMDHTHFSRSPRHDPFSACAPSFVACLGCALTELYFSGGVENALPALPLRYHRMQWYSLPCCGASLGRDALGATTKHTLLHFRHITDLSSSSSEFFPLWHFICLRYHGPDFP